MPSHSHIIPRLLNTHVVDAWSSVTQFSSLKVLFRRATLFRPVITIHLTERIAVPSCLHIRPNSGGFAFARSNETACDQELHWSEATEWTILPEVLTDFSAHPMERTPRAGCMIN